jgi:cytoskeletal protein RodZ
VDNGADTAVPQEGAPSPGPILAAERERQGLSRADIAQRLHMSVAQVEALEVGDYERLPRGPFLRGFARNYARALGLDAGAIVGLLATNAPLEIAPRMFDPPADAEGGGVIRMKFRASAWVEVKDARGKVLLSRNQPGGSDAEVAGKPPLSVVIGNAADVRLTYNDREVDLEPHTRVSVARLTLP